MNPREEWELERLRRLKGLGGARFFDVPGVKYPEEAFHAKEGMDPKTGEKFSVVPKGMISSEEAAKLLGCSATAARLFLHSRKVKFARVALPHALPCVYWAKSRVKKLAAARVPIVTSMPAKLVDSEGARAILKVGRSTLYRYVQKGLLEEVQVRMMTAKGTRKMSFYLKAAVKKLAAALNAAREHEREAAAMRYELRSKKGKRRK